MNPNDHESILNGMEDLASRFDAEAARSFAAKNRTMLWYPDFDLLLRMITDPEYRVEPKTYLIVAGVLVYVASPVELFPSLEGLDILLILAVVMRTVANELERYKAFLKERGEEFPEEWPPFIL